MHSLPDDLPYPALATIALAGLGIWLLMTDRYRLSLFFFAGATIIPRAMQALTLTEALSLFTPR